MKWMSGVIVLVCTGLLGWAASPASKVSDAEPSRTMRVGRGVNMLTLPSMGGNSKTDKDGQGGFLGSTLHLPENLYHRTGEFTCRVESVIDIYTAIEKDITPLFGGEITALEITGNDDGRQGTIECSVSVDKFNEFVTYIRKKGKVLSERIAATAKSKEPAKETGERKLSLVSVTVIDEKVARELGESKGMLAASFSRSTSHFLRGVAVIVEGLGWILPYALVLAGLAVPLAIVGKMCVRFVPHQQHPTDPPQAGTCSALTPGAPTSAGVL